MREKQQHTFNIEINKINTKFSPMQIEGFTDRLEWEEIEQISKQVEKGINLSGRKRLGKWAEDYF